MAPRARQQDRAWAPFPAGRKASSSLALLDKPVLRPTNRVVGSLRGDPQLRLGTHSGPGQVKISRSRSRVSLPQSSQVGRSGGVRGYTHANTHTHIVCRVQVVIQHKHAHARRVLTAADAAIGSCCRLDALSAVVVALMHFLIH